MLILASASPRRHEILTLAGLEFVVRVPGIEEVRVSGERPRDYVRRLARAKAETALGAAGGDIVLAADTVVVLDDHVLEKPVDRADAERMLRLLSGRKHEVVTGVCLHRGSRSIVDVAVTRVRFAVMTDGEIAEYAATGEPMDKAGAYAIQGFASKFIQGIDGCYFNVMGLPVSLVYRHLKELWAEPS